jgi:hypothetical protein
MHKVVNTWWCWHICKGEEVGKEEVAKPGLGCCLGASPPPVRCTPTPMAVTIWTWPRASRVGASTATDGVHRPTRDGAAPVGAIVPFLQRLGKRGAGLGWHRHTLFGATAVCSVTIASQTSRWIRPLGGTATPRAVPPPPCLVPS